MLQIIQALNIVPTSLFPRLSKTLSLSCVMTIHVVSQELRVVGGAGCLLHSQHDYLQVHGVDDSSV